MWEDAFSSFIFCQSMPKHSRTSRPGKRQSKATAATSLGPKRTVPAAPGTAPVPEMLHHSEPDPDCPSSLTDEVEDADVPCGMNDYETEDLKALASGKLGQVDADQLARIKKELARREKEQAKKAQMPSTTLATETPDGSGFRILGAGAEGDYDAEWYDVFETLSTEWPLLAIDSVVDRLGASRVAPPHTLTLVGATQEEDAGRSHLQLISLRGVDGPYRRGTSKPVVVIKDRQCAPVTRLRTTPMWDVGDGSVAALVAAHTEGEGVKLFSVGRAAEGASPWKALGTLPCAESYALAWGGSDASRPEHHVLAYGAGGAVLVADIEHAFNAQKHTLTVSSRAHKAWKGWNHGTTRGTVEDIAFSHEGAGRGAYTTSWTSFASCGTDGCVGLWDTRQGESYGLVGAFRTPHRGDINVLDWADGHIVTGGEDGALMLWDTRNISASLPASGRPRQLKPKLTWRFHKGPITSVAFSPHEECVFYACSDDGTLSVWNYDCEAVGSNPSDVPPELVFLHQGLEEPRELRPHPQIPGLLIVTGLNGLDIFKPRNVGVDHTALLDEEEEEEDSESSATEESMHTE